MRITLCYIKSHFKFKDTKIDNIVAKRSSTYSNYVSCLRNSVCLFIYHCIFTLFLLLVCMRLLMKVRLGVHVLS